MLEKDRQKKILDYLNSLPKAFFFKYHPTIYSVSGIPDILGVQFTQFYGIEVKQPGKKATKLQQDKIDKINACGGIAFVATSVEDVKNVFEGEGRRYVYKGDQKNNVSD